MNTISTERGSIPDPLPIRRALLSVYDKEAVVPLARALHAQGVQLYASEGTSNYLQTQDLPVHSLSAVTGQADWLDGRVKTLHPGVFAGILYKQENPLHVQTLEQEHWVGFEMVVVDLYPFEDSLREANDRDSCIEHIDIGGVALLRAAAKNHAQVWVVAADADGYSLVMTHLKTQGATSSLALRKQAAAAALAYSSRYDAHIAQWLDQQVSAAEKSKETSHSPQANVLALGAQHVLRYGENPHQSGCFYGDLGSVIEQKQGQALSYNNLLDIDTGLGLAEELGAGAFVIIKHCNPCGVAVQADCLLAYEKAWAGDKVSAFGGIFVYNGRLSAAVAEQMVPYFFEVVAAKSYEKSALEIFATKPKRRVLVIQSKKKTAQVYRSALGGFLAQQADQKVHNPQDWDIVTTRQVDADMLADMAFALCVAKWSSSNAIVLAKAQQVVGISSGQTARIDALHMAIEKAQRGALNLKGAVMASEAFLPFEDSVSLAHDNGIMAVVQPGGSIQDARVIDYCNAHNMCMVFCKTRHFRH